MSLNTNLISYYKFDTDNATQPDEQGAHAGTVTGATYNAGGKINGCYTFDASTEKIVLADESAFDFERTSPFSISMWVNISNVSTRFFWAKSHAADAPAYRGYCLWHNGNNLEFGLVNTATTNQISVQTGFTTTGTWVHIVATYDGSSNATGVRIYINGVSVSLVTIINNLSATILNDKSFELANRLGGFNFAGAIDEVGIWSRAITATEVTALYNGGTGLSTPFPTYVGKINDVDVNTLLRID